MLELANLRPGELLVDLGCGDGAILRVGAKRFDALALGYEVNPALVAKTLKLAREEGVGHLVRVIPQDLFKADIRMADVVALYLTPAANRRLAPLLLEQLRPTARVVTHNYPIPGWKPLMVERVGNHYLYLYQPGLSAPFPATRKTVRTTLPKLHRL
jgi:SAM-dependent methyltransferase